MKWVVDASVALKWFFQHRPDEADVDTAMAVLERVDAGDIELIQPPHFVAEVGAVLARKSPLRAANDLQELLDIDFETSTGAIVHSRALELALRFDHHLFDTLYHAVAIETPGARLLTADLRYVRKANDPAHVVALSAAGQWLN